jgi:hypothetical protein
MGINKFNYLIFNQFILVLSKSTQTFLFCDFISDKLGKFY